MSEDEMYNSDLHTIYRLIDIHYDTNVPKDSKGKKVKENNETFIDNIVF